MSANHHLSLALALPLITLAAGVAMAQESVDREAEEPRIRELDRQWVEAVQAKDAQAVADLYTEDGRVMPPNAAQAEGTDVVREFWAGLFELPNVSLTFEPTTVDVAEAGDMAYDIGTYSLAFDGDQGRVEDEGKYVVVWTK